MSKTYRYQPEYSENKSKKAFPRKSKRQKLSKYFTENTYDDIIDTDDIFDDIQYTDTHDNTR
jgi:hypothetical protein